MSETEGQNASPSFSGDAIGSSRVCGEQRMEHAASQSICGSSLRVRGTERLSSWVDGR